jgi:hypothetical protein
LLACPVLMDGECGLRQAGLWEGLGDRRLSWHSQGDGDYVRRWEKGVEEVILKVASPKTFHQPFINSRLCSPPIRPKGGHRSHRSQ